jgi:hypothetical protein
MKIASEKKTPNDKPVHLNREKTQVIFMNLSGCPTPCFKNTKQERPQELALNVANRTIKTWRTNVSFNNPACREARIKINFTLYDMNSSNSDDVDQEAIPHHLQNKINL